MFKEAGGVGLGEGDTENAVDVSAQIENEDQIMGAHQEGKQQDTEDADKGGTEGAKEMGKEDAEGVEMGQDFDGELVSEGEAGAEEDEVRPKPSFTSTSR